MPDSSLFQLKAIPLIDHEKEIWIDCWSLSERIEELVWWEAERYQDAAINSLKIPFYYYYSENHPEKISDEMILMLIQNVSKSGFGEFCDQPKELVRRKCRYSGGL